MDSLVTLFSNYTLVDIIVFAVVLGSSITGVYTVSKKVTGLLESYRLAKNNIEDKDKTIENNFKDLSKKIDSLNTRLDSVDKEISKIKNDLISIQDNINRTNKAISRSTVYRLANELIAKKWMTESEYESLQELSNVYLKSGDTKFVVPNIIQRALDLPVLTEEEIESRMNKLNSLMDDKVVNNDYE